MGVFQVIYIVQLRYQIAESFSYNFTTTSLGKDNNVGCFPETEKRKYSSQYYTLNKATPQE